MLGSVDANQGHPHLGWDTDEFPSDLYATTLAMYEILKNGGLEKGGLNFDAKVRRTSFKPEDLFKAHIVGMDSFALGAKVAQRMIDDKAIDSIIDKRYSSFNNGIGKDIVDGNTDFKKLQDYALGLDKIENESGNVEVIKGILNQYLVTTIAEG
jgi:xylose isomerase